MFILLLCFPSLISAQKFDNIWTIGHDYDVSDSVNKGTIINFSSNPPQTLEVTQSINFHTSAGSMSDSSGNLLFFTNGCDIAGADGEILPGGDGLNPGYAHALRCDNWNLGYAGGHPNIIILPKPENVNIYYIFHKRQLSVGWPPVDSYNDKLFYTLVTKDSITGGYYVPEKMWKSYLIHFHTAK